MPDTIPSKNELLGKVWELIHLVKLTGYQRFPAKIQFKRNKESNDSIRIMNEQTTEKLLNSSI